MPNLHPALKRFGIFQNTRYLSLFFIISAFLGVVKQHPQAGTKSLVVLGGIFYQDSYFGHRVIPFPDQVLSGATPYILWGGRRLCRLRFEVPVNSRNEMRFEGINFPFHSHCTRASAIIELRNLTSTPIL